MNSLFVFHPVAFKLPEGKDLSTLFSDVSKCLKQGLGQDMNLIKQLNSFRNQMLYC